MTMVRGSNPIWFEVDLTAHAFDDTFYLFILGNDIPYIPATVWQDPNANVAWDNPIQFLANGTLPNNIYYDPDTVYRLEFRQGPTQADPLIYLVENYVPGASGETPINEPSFATDNQISNPQFALINFVSPLNLTSITTQVIQVAPGWFLNLTGSGNVILTQVLINNSTSDPTNASYALQIELNGAWTNAYLSQRFDRTGVLWSNTFVSSSITALSGNAPQNISAILMDSQSNTVATLLPVTPLTQTFNAYAFVAQAAASADTDFPPPLGTAYLEYQLLLPNNCNITLTSVQLISGDVSLEYPYEQTTIERQIDQTYHNAYPIVPIGTIIPFMGFATPLHYLFCDGTAYSRITYQLLFQTLTTTETVTLTMSTTSFTVANPTNYYIGMAIEGNGIQANTTITNIVGTTVTMSNSATISGSSVVRFFISGNGDGSTTFNVPDLRGYGLAGAYGSLFATNGPGAKAGTATSTLTNANMPQHTHPIGSPLVDFVGTGGGGAGPFAGSAGSSFSAVANTGVNSGSSASPTPVNITQPTALARMCIRYE